MFAMEFGFSRHASRGPQILSKSWQLKNHMVLHQFWHQKWVWPYIAKLYTFWVKLAGKFYLWFGYKFNWLWIQKWKLTRNIDFYRNKNWNCKTLIFWLWKRHNFHQKIIRKNTSNQNKENRSNFKDIWTFWSDGSSWILWNQICCHWLSERFWNRKNNKKTKLW